MAKRTPFKNPTYERTLFRRRALLAGLLALLLVLLLVVRLYYLQVDAHQHYTTLSQNNRVSILPLAPTRGLIFDRNGVILAENLPHFSLDIIPERVDDIEHTLEQLSALITIDESDRERFKRERKNGRKFEQIPLRLNLNEQEVAQVAINLYRLPGVEINSRLMRHYPLGKLTTHVVGYVGRINKEELEGLTEPSNYSATHHIGKRGVEKSYEPLLHGRVGYQKIESNAHGRTIRVLEQTPPTPGNNLRLNIDVRLQQAASEALGEEHGAVVAIDPNDGAVLALVSEPSYDGNLFVSGISYNNYQTLTGSKSKPLFNRALSGQYPPGSTLKPMLGLAGLEHHLLTNKDKVICKGFYQLPNDDHKYRDWKKRGHGTINLHSAIVESCDVFFYELGLRLTIDRQHSFLSMFGLGRRTGIDTSEEARGLLPSRQWKLKTKGLYWYPGETLNASIGQGYTLTTPLQLANAVATIAMRGKRYQPRVVNAVVDQTSGEQSTLELKAESGANGVDPHSWDYIVHAMQQVVHGPRGSARGINPGKRYTMAGKTGTAQVFTIKQDEEYEADEVKKHLRDHALFIAFAPVEHPQIAVAVVVENGGGGGSTAAPIARRVLDTYLLHSPRRP